MGEGKRKYEEVVEEERGPRGPKVPRSQGPRYLKVTFKYELDSKEGPSCLSFFLILIISRKKT